MNNEHQSQERLHPIAEHYHPLVWTLLNSAALIVSLVLAWQLIIALDDFNERPGAAGIYLSWNFATTLLWLTEV